MHVALQDIQWVSLLSSRGLFSNSFCTVNHFVWCNSKTLTRGILIYDKASNSNWPLHVSITSITSANVQGTHVWISGCWTIHSTLEKNKRMKISSMFLNFGKIMFLESQGNFAHHQSWILSLKYSSEQEEEGNTQSIETKEFFFFNVTCMPHAHINEKKRR